MPVRVLLDIAAVLLFTGLGLRCLRLARDQPVQGVRRIVGLLAAAALFATTEALRRLLKAAVAAELLPADPTRVVVAVWGVGALIFGLVLGVVAYRVATQACAGLAKADRVLGVLAGGDLEGPRPSQATLTPREREVLGLLAEGAVTDAQIADRLCVSRETARSHVKRMVAKTGARNRHHLMLLAVADLATGGQEPPQRTPDRGAA